MTLTNFEGDNNADLIRTILIDDELHARETLTRLVSLHCPQIRLVGEADGVASGLKIIRELHPQLVLLDVKMDDGTGFDLLRAIEAVDFKVIFITAYEKFAIQAFRFAAVDFLLKPVNPEELIEAVRHAEILIQEHFTTQLQALEENFRTDIRQKRKVVLKTLESIHLVEVQDITFCESDGAYTIVHTVAGVKIMISKNLREFDDMLCDSGFYRVHKSYLINLSHIIRFDKNEGGYIILAGGEKVPVSFRKREELLELFEKLAE
jgi:two-component system, LytTR family, response regulator